MFVVQVDKSRLHLLESEMLVSMAVNVYPIRFEFSKDWDGFSKVALFYNSNNEKAYSVLLDESNTANIPAEVLMEFGGTVYVGVCGENESNKHLPTLALSLGEVEEGICTPAFKPEDPTPDIYQQILARLSSIEETLSKL